MQESSSLNLIFVNGKGGAGKGTMLEHLLRETPGSCEISTGKIYRGAKSGVGEYAEFKPDVTPYIDSVDNHGGLLPDEVIVPIVGIVVARRVDEGFTTFVFDGFPRTIPQLEETDRMIADLRQGFEPDREVIAKFICYATTDERSLGRTEGRRLSDIKKGKVLRPEDEPKKARERLNVYKEEGKTEDMLHILAREKRLMVIKGSSGSKDGWRRLKRELEHGQTTDRELPRLAREKET